MPHEWAGDPRVGIAVVIGTGGPMDPLLSGTLYDVTDFGGVNYVQGEPGIEIGRGRSDEFSNFQAGTCTFTLRNDNREFDPARTRVALDVPSTPGASASTPDVAAFAPAGDLDVRMQLSMDQWVPGGFGQVIAAQWSSPSNEGWLFGVSPTGLIQFVFTTDGATDLARTSTVPTNFVAGSVHWIRAVLDVNNGAGGHDVIFYTSDDGVTWNQLGTTVTNAGTVTVFNSTNPLAISDVLPMAGQVYRFEFRNNGLLVANPDFSAQTIGDISFVDSLGLTWTVNGTASIRFDDHASVFAPILKPRRQVFVLVGLLDDPSTTRFLFTGYLEGWPQTWTNTTGSVELVASDLLSVLAQTSTSEGRGVLVLDDPYQGRLDFGRLGGDLPQQFSGERVAALMGLADVSSELVDVGLTQMVATEPSGDVLSLCQEAEIAEAGFLFVNTAGRVVFLDRHSRFQDTRLSTVQATFTDSEYSGLAVDYSLAQMWNVARFTRPAFDDADEPQVQIATDDSSTREFGVRSYPASGVATIPVLSDAEALGRSEFWVDRYAQPQQRPSPVVVKPRRNLAGLFLRVAGRDLLDRIQLVRTPLGVGDPVTFTGLVEQIRHRITEVEWDCTLGISPIDVDEGQSFLVLDDATRGQLDQETLSY